MRNLIYMMVFQILIGIWLMVSPFVLGYREIKNLTTNNLIFGAIVLILGIGVTYYQKVYLGIEHMIKKSVNGFAPYKIRRRCLFTPSHLFQISF